jgi:tripartite ATP-independent transporter DctM subunit
MQSLNKVINILDKVSIFSRWTNIIGITFLFLMIVLNFVDVILDTKIILHAIKGATEITEVMMIAGIFLAVANSQNEKAHISVDAVTSLLSQKWRLIVGFITSLLGLGTIALVIWRVILQAIYFAEKNMMHAQYLGIPSVPFTIIIAIGVIALWLLMLRDFLKIIVEANQVSLSKYQWLIMVAVPVFLAVFIVFWMQPKLWDFDLTALAVIGIIFFVALLLSGMPIAYTMILTAVVFVGNIRGASTAFNMVATDIYRTSGTYAFAVLPFFVLMGYFCLHAKFGEDLYIWGYRWFGHLRGGLSTATICACTAFAAIVGDPIAAVSTMGSAAMPEMNKYEYDSRLSAGSIVAGASLGPIIPPSSAFILVGFLTGVPIGKLLISGVVPGLLMSACFILVVYIWCRINPQLGPAGAKSNWGARFSSLKAVGPVLVIFIVAIGGIYAGLFTPTRGGAVGAFAAFVLALVMRRYTWKSFTQALLDGGRTVSTVFLILIGALMFTRFVAWCNISETLTALIINLGLSPTVFMLVTLIFFLFMGFWIDILPMILIGFPVFFPIAMAMGIDPIWFCLLIVVVINLGGMTPPVGVIMFVLKGVRPEIPINTIYRGTLPFVFATVVAVIIIFLVPVLATWLPNLMK